MGWIESTDDSVRIRIWLQPRASANEVVGVHEDHLKVKITSPPVDNRANKDLRNFLAKRLRVSAARIEILSGLSSRRKVLGVTGVTADEIRGRLITQGRAG